MKHEMARTHSDVISKKQRRYRKNYSAFVNTDTCWEQSPYLTSFRCVI